MDAADARADLELRRMTPGRAGEAANDEGCFPQRDERCPDDGPHRFGTGIGGCDRGGAWRWLAPGADPDSGSDPATVGQACGRVARDHRAGALVGDAGHVSGPAPARAVSRTDAMSHERNDASDGAAFSRLSVPDCRGYRG